MVTGEYGYLAPDGVYRTTVYSSSPQTGYVVLAQTRKQRGKEEDKEFEFNYTTVDSKVNHEGHHHEVKTCIIWCHYPSLYAGYWIPRHLPSRAVLVGQCGWVPEGGDLHS